MVSSTGAFSSLTMRYPASVRLVPVLYCIITRVEAHIVVLSEAEGAHLYCGVNPLPGHTLSCHATIQIPPPDSTEEYATKEICIPASEGVSERCIQASIVWFEKESGSLAGDISCDYKDAKTIRCTATLPAPDVGKTEKTKNPLSLELCQHSEQCLRVSIAWRDVEPEVVLEKGGEESVRRGDITAIVQGTRSSNEPVCTEVGTCSSNTSGERDPDKLSSAPVKLDKADGTTIIIGEQSYKKPYAKYGRMVSATLSEIRRMLLMEDKLPGGDENKSYEHVVALADLCSELATGHSENLLDAQEGRYVSRPQPEEHRRSIAAYKASLKLYHMASAILESLNQPLYANHDVDVLTLLAAGATTTLHLADMVLADPEINDDMADGDGEGGDNMDVSPYYTNALRLTRQAMLLYEHALVVLKDLGQQQDGDERVVIQLGVADAAMRLGNLYVAMYEQGILTTLVEDASDDITIPFDTPAVIDYQDLSSSSQAFGVDEERVLEEAKKYFERASSGYSRHASVGDGSAEDRLLLADSLHSNGIVNLYLSNFPKCIENWEESLEIYLDVESKGVVDRKDIGLIIGENLQNLSDALLQSGRYDESTNRYREAMQKYAELSDSGTGGEIPILQPHHIKTSTSMSSPFDSEDAIQVYKDALDQYYQSVESDNEVPVDYDFDSTSQFDELYEADLLAALGSIYLSRQEPNEALQHLLKAIRLYEEYSEAEEDDLALADAYLNKALCLFYMGNYDESIQAHEQAVELYELLPQDGENPKQRQGTGKVSVDDERTDGAGIRERLINVDELMQGLQNMTA